MPLLDLDANDLKVLNDALVVQPYGTVAPLIAKINMQLIAQALPAEDEPSLPEVEHSKS